jgi:hypothetical protein
MFTTDNIVVWNLSPGGTARSGAVSIFNVVGRLKRPEGIREVSYRLNGDDEMPVYFEKERARLPLRLGHPGEFNIDTIACSQLREHNVLEFRTVRDDGRTFLDELPFRIHQFPTESPAFLLDLSSAETPEEVGQVVEGPWQVSTDEFGRRCLEVSPEGAGYDRVILFGRREWTTGYELLARFSVTALTGMHNIGLVFKWNPHKQGDGTFLPSQWSTGLGYYCSYGEPGLRIRFGVDVHRTAEDEKVGDHLLGHAHLDRARYRRSWVVSKLARSGAPSELVLGRDYMCRLRVHPQRYSLALWEASRFQGPPRQRTGEPAPQVVVERPDDLLPRGSVGFIAHQAGIRLYQYQARPLC